MFAHTGAILGNKFSKHRPSTAQQSRLRELATSSMLLTPSSNETSYDNSDASSTLATSPSDARFSERSKSPRRSFASSNRPASASSSMLSLHVPGKAPSFPNTMTMTPVQSKNRASSAESQAAGGKGSKENDEKGGFMAQTLSILKRKDHSQSSSTAGAEDGEETSVRKPKSTLGKKILGSLS